MRKQSKPFRHFNRRIWITYVKNVFILNNAFDILKSYVSTVNHTNNFTTSEFKYVQCLIITPSLSQKLPVSCINVHAFAPCDSSPHRKNLPLNSSKS